jgi:hypothetical protein
MDKEFCGDETSRDVGKIRIELDADKGPRAMLTTMGINLPN